MATAAEKRKSFRFPCAVPVDGKADSIFAQTATVDFSKGGLGFISRRQIPLNKEIAIQLDLNEDNRDPILVIGKVKWVRQMAGSCYRIGLVFEEFLKGARSPLKDYFQQHKA